MSRYTINPPDETYSVIYLGNVLTVMARGENCYEKPLSLIWKAYCSRSRNDLGMNLEITRSGLKAETKQQGLTEYWAHRVTFSAAPPEYPKVFCWIYKHDGKRLKPELRCHAVLCKKNSEPGVINTKLQRFLQAALQEYKREKLSAQNARLNGAAGCPRRKQILQTGTLNFRPPVSRSKSAPRLGSIDEEQEEEHEEELEEIEEEDDCVSDPDNLSVCYRAAPDLESNSSKCDGGTCSSSSSTTATGPSSVCSEEDRTRLQPTDPDSVSEESGYHEERKIVRESSEEIYGSDNDLVILEEDYEDDEDEEQVTSL
ncbi:unnamed protein product [Caenorhabditis angaria]|uniref:PID domain-containing protein n=1 Tax=Caenorhabditis angaria TaxID=860376 RepID=A0A9P1NBL4_9PELO|nr:unnamed protein product [Caenorhabditis angaria]